MAVEVFTNRPTVSDVVKNFYDEGYCFVGAPIKNVLATIAAGALKPGMFLKLNGSTWETLAAANVADADGIFADSRKCEGIASSATSVKSYRIMTNGPGKVNVNLCLLDPVGAAITAAAAKSALRALSPKIEVVVEPTNVETQTE